MECHKAARRAASLGYHNLYIMPAGIVGWIKAGQRVVKGDQAGS
jgi:rhodanese-related sulfurtransferase